MVVQRYRSDTLPASMLHLVWTIPPSHHHRPMDQSLRNQTQGTSPIQREFLLETGKHKTRGRYPCTRTYRRTNHRCAIPPTDACEDDTCSCMPACVDEKTKKANVRTIDGPTILYDFPTWTVHLVRNETSIEASGGTTQRKNRPPSHPLP